MSDYTVVRFVGRSPRGFGRPGFGPRPGFARPGLKKSELRIVKRLRKLAMTLVSTRDMTSKAQRHQIAEVLDRTITEVKAIIEAPAVPAETENVSA